MESDITSYLEARKEQSCVSIYQYTTLVADLEFLHEQNPVLSKNESLRSKYKELWDRLEIINACALDEWDTQGRPANFSNIWDEKYKIEAAKVLDDLICFLKGHSFETSAFIRFGGS